MSTSAGDAGVATRRRRAVFHSLRVAEVARLTPDSVAVTFEVPAELAADYRFTPGQHVTLRTTLGGRDVRRSYSICSPSTRRDRLQVAVKRVAGGQFSQWVNDELRAGHRLDVMTPMGRFGLGPDPQAGRHVCAVAAGSGITPVMSILATVLEVEPRSGCTLIYGNRTSRDVMFLEEIHDLKDRHPARLQILHVLSREAQESASGTGRVDRARMTELLSSIVPPDLIDEWFLCGPYSMVEEVRAALTAAGVAPGTVSVELFHAESTSDAQPPATQRVSPADGADGIRATAVLDGRSTSVDVRPGERLLDAILRARPDAPYSCRGGVCGTCRARVVEGEVEMDRNYALDPRERTAGFVLTCRSVPRTPAVTLDFDA